MNTMNDFDVQVQRDKSLRVLNAVWLYDEDEECRRLVDESPEYGVYAHEALRKQDATLHSFGEDYARVVAPAMADEPMGLVEQTLAGMPEARRGVYQGEFDQLRLSGKDTRQDYYALYGKLVRDEVRGQYEEQKKLAASVNSALKNSTSIIPWHTYLTLVEKQEMQHKRKLPDHWKHQIYNQWSKKIKEKEHQKQIEIESCKKKREKAILIAISSLIGLALLLIIIRVSYKKRIIIYHSIQPILRPFPLTICALLGIAVFDLPYGYYQFLRIAVTTWAILTLIQANNRLAESPGKTCTMLLTGGIAILYNPIFPIHLDKDTWTLLNIISIPLILLITFLTPHRSAGLSCEGVASADAKPPTP